MYVEKNDFLKKKKKKIVCTNYVSDNILTIATLLLFVTGNGRDVKIPVQREIISI